MTSSSRRASFSLMIKETGGRRAVGHAFGHKSGQTGGSSPFHGRRPSLKQISMNISGNTNLLQVWDESAHFLNLFAELKKKVVYL